MINAILTERINYWCRLILNSYWILIVISIAAELTCLVVIIHQTPEEIVYFIWIRMILPTVILLVIMAIHEYIHRTWQKPNAYFIVLTGVSITSVLIIVNPLIHGIAYVFALPLLVSLFFYQMRVLVITLICVLVLFFIMYQFSSSLQASNNLLDLFAFFFTMISLFVVEVGLLKRGLSLIDYLGKTIQSEQELLVKTAVMDKLSKTDALTDLYNHKTFHEYLDELVEQSEVNLLPLHLAIVDIDNFKSINDTYGHAVGDLILKRVAKVISEAVSPSEIVARYGGEEFTIIFTEKSLLYAFQTAERIRMLIHSALQPEMENKQVSVSIGLSSYKKGSNKSLLFTESDTLLYEAKRTGKNKTIMSTL
ncbi:GGDEF domain-containing protein [Paenibacillus sp. SYP-B3998]|uniref:GGDEF domain-containing protein n=1 Tax=Paenibacillus sp. SYP-B3998 TaxID=2678564 RepID=A0A6G3ZZ63_9BACL|nr:GGDEF domain-containing protein [Paenibacillus sp. SYP-B3998]NEW06984.1 GGDEF domain-containing protein [Paenibacillus sp. SYP-B3998]